MPPTPDFPPTVVDTYDGFNDDVSLTEELTTQEKAQLALLAGDEDTRSPAELLEALVQISAI